MNTFKLGILVFLSLLILTPIPNVTATVGVKVGNWAKYSVSSGWDSNIPDVTEPEDLVDLVNTVWVKLEVQSISHNTVTITKTFHFKDGTERSVTASGDISTSSGGIWWFIIPAGLSSGDTVVFTYVPFIGTSLSIDETVKRNYADISREVNHIDETFTVTDYGNGELDAYWDKATGLLCEFSLLITASILSYYMTMSMTMKMLETNAWSLPAPIWQQLWFLAAIAAVVVAVAAGLAIFIRRRKRPPTEAVPEAIPPSPPEPTVGETPSSAFP